jgi:hypothetical protein
MNLDAVLTSRPQWIVWEWQGEDRRKVPVRPDSRYRINPHEPLNWMTLELAEQWISYWKQHGVELHLGFVLTPDDPIICVDLDGCRNPTTGEMVDWAITLIGEFDSYTEFSPSGSGVKIFIRSEANESIRASVKLVNEPVISRKLPGIEVFSEKQFVAITGESAYWNDRVESRPEPLARLRQRLKDVSSGTSSTSTFRDNPDASEDAVAEARRSVEDMPEAISGAMGHNATFAVACRLMIDYALSFDQAWEILCEYNERCSPPWDAHELKHKLVDAGKKSSERGWRSTSAVMARFMEEVDMTAVAQCSQLSNAVAVSTSFLSKGPVSMVAPILNNVIYVSNIPPEWAELLPLNTAGYVEMSADDFPPTLSEFISAVAAYTETPVELPGLMSLGVLATACQRKYEVCLPEGHFEPLNLWVCPAMGPGNRKTAVVKTVVKPLAEWEQETRSRLRPEIEQSRSKRKSMEKRIDYLRTAAAKKVTEDQRQAMLDEIRTLENELPPDRHYPVLKTDDCTPEHIAVMMNRNEERMSFISDEGGVFGMMAGRYSRDIPNIEVYLQGHAGSSVRVHRGSREDIDLQAPCLTIAVSPQPAVLEQVAGNTAFNGRGLLDRFLFAMPKSRLGYRELIPKPIPEEIESSWNRLIKQILDLPQSRNAYGGLMPHKLKLTQGAYMLWKNEQMETEVDMRPGNAWGSAPGWASKYPGAVLRIAGLFHVATCVQLGVSPESSEVDDAVMRYAIRIGRVIKQQSGVAFGLMRLDAKQHLAVRVSEWIQCQAKTQFTCRDVVRALNGGRSNGMVNDVLGILEESGWIRPVQQPEPRGKGRPPRSFEVNPLVFSNR